MVYYLIKAGFHLQDIFLYSELYQPAEHPFILVRTTITSGILYLFNRKDARAAFGISQKEYLGVLISGAILSLLVILSSTHKKGAHDRAPRHYPIHEK
jgi:hypothetical protein